MRRSSPRLLRARPAYSIEQPQSVATKRLTRRALNMVGKTFRARSSKPASRLSLIRLRAVRQASSAVNCAFENRFPGYRHLDNVSSLKCPKPVDQHEESIVVPSLGAVESYRSPISDTAMFQTGPKTEACLFAAGFCPAPPVFDDSLSVAGGREQFHRTARQLNLTLSEPGQSRQWTRIPRNRALEKIGAEWDPKT